MPDLTRNEQDVFDALRDAPSWWPGANPTALLAVMHGQGTSRGRSIESVQRSLRSMERKGFVHRNGAGWHLGSGATALKPKQKDEEN